MLNDSIDDEFDQRSLDQPGLAPIIYVSGPDNTQVPSMQVQWPRSNEALISQMDFVNRRFHFADQRGGLAVDEDIFESEHYVPISGTNPSGEHSPILFLPGPTPALQSETVQVYFAEFFRDSRHPIPDRILHAPPFALNAPIAGPASPEYSLLSGYPYSSTAHVDFTTWRESGTESLTIPHTPDCRNTHISTTDQLISVNSINTTTYGAQDGFGISASLSSASSFPRYLGAPLSSVSHRRSRSETYDRGHRLSSNGESAAESYFVHSSEGGSSSSSCFDASVQLLSSPSPLVSRHHRHRSVSGTADSTPPQGGWFSQFAYGPSSAPASSSGSPSVGPYHPTDSSSLPGSPQSSILSLSDNGSELPSSIFPASSLESQVVKQEIGTRAMKEANKKKKKHTFGPSFRCRFCMDTFTTKFAMDRHVGTHYGKRYPCEQPGCRVNFGNPSDRQRHMKKKHNLRHF